MKQIHFLYILFCMCTFAANGQNKKNSSTEGFSTTTSGLHYKIIKDSVGVNYPEKGGFITFWFELRTTSDSIFDSQFLDSNPDPVGIPTPVVKHEQSIEEGLLLLTEGDSALFILNADSLFQNSFGREAPSFIPMGATIQFVVKMGKVYSKHFVDSVMSNHKIEADRIAAAEQKNYLNDSIAIQEYILKHKLKAEAITSGVYIVRIKAGKKKSPYIVKGEIVEAAYIGKLLIEDKEFDQSVPGKYFEFTVGLGEVIKGWDYAFQRLKLGEKALILIPSGLGYGSVGVPGVIPENAPLLFEVTIKKD